jgi:AcrR family transcriptional regulator
LAGQKRIQPQVDRAQARRELDVARKREGILNAAARAFARGGYHVTTMQEIAREAGYTPPSLYSYFASKEQIFLELAAMLSREFIAVIEQPVPAGLPFSERVALLLQRLFEKADHYRDAVSVFVVARLSGESLLGQGMTLESNHEGAEFSSVQLLAAWIGRNAKRGELGGHRPEELGVALAGLAHAFCIQSLASGAGASVASQATRVAALFLHGALGSPQSKKPPRSR